MKLYTEAEIISAYEKAELCHLRMESFIKLMTPIELPSDEEILKESDEFELNSRVSLGMHISFELGAKWMRDKIQGGKK